MNYIHSFFLYKLPNGLGHWVGLTAGEAVLYTGICGPFGDATRESIVEMSRLDLQPAAQSLMDTLLGIREGMPFPAISENSSMDEKIKEIERRMEIITLHKRTLDLIEDHVLKHYVGDFLAESTD